MLTGEKSKTQPLSAAELAYLAEMRDAMRRAEERGQTDTFFHDEVLRLESRISHSEVNEHGKLDQ